MPSYFFAIEKQSSIVYMYLYECVFSRSTKIADLNHHLDLVIRRETHYFCESLIDSSSTVVS